MRPFLCMDAVSATGRAAECTAEALLRREHSAQAEPKGHASVCSPRRRKRKSKRFRIMFSRGDAEARRREWVR